MKIIKIFKSKTVWCFIALFLLNGIQGVKELLSPQWIPLADAILVLLGAYSRINPKVDFKN